jgi:membrane protease YdiL (CAAX protease family)
MNRSDIRAAAAISILLALASGGLARVSLEWRVLGVEIVAVLALIYVWRRWAHLLPHGGVPWYRLILVTTLVIVSLFVAGQSVPDGGGFSLSFTDDHRPNPIYAIAVGLLAVPTALFYELFLRGVVYSLFEQRGGGGLAIAGSTAVSTFLILTAGLALPALIAGVLTSLVLAWSRWLTRSITPAVAAQVFAGAYTALFMFLIAAS